MKKFSEGLTLMTVPLKKEHQAIFQLVFIVVSMLHIGFNVEVDFEVKYNGRLSINGKKIPMSKRKYVLGKNVWEIECDFLLTIKSYHRLTKSLMRTGLETIVKHMRRFMQKNKSHVFSRQMIILYGKYLDDEYRFVEEEGNEELYQELDRMDYKDLLQFVNFLTFLKK